MSVQNKTILKTYFETGDKPTQSQFENLIDSLAHVNDLSNNSAVNEPIPISESITANDNGKLAMLDFDGEIKLYQESPALAGVKGKWKITFNNLSTSETSLYYQEDAGSTFNFSAGSWNMSVTTVEEEATAFAAFITSSYPNVFSVTSGANANEVILEQIAAKALKQPFNANNGNVIISIIVNATDAVPKAPRRLCVGILKSIDETNHTAVFDDIVVLPTLNAPNVANILVECEQRYGFEHAYTLAQLVAIPTDGGKVRAILEGELQNSNFAFNSLQNALYFFIKPHTYSNKFYCIKRGLG